MERNKKIFKKFCDEIKFKKTETMIDAEMSALENKNEKNDITFLITFKSIPNVNDFFDLLWTIKNQTNYDIKVKFLFNVIAYDKQLVISYLKFLFQNKTKYRKLNSFDFETNLAIENGINLVFHLPMDELKNDLIDLIPSIEKNLKKYGFTKINVSYVNIEMIENNYKIEEKEKKDISNIEIKNHLNNVLSPTKETNFSKFTNSLNNKINKSKLRNIAYIERKINDIDSMYENDYVVIKGIVFKQEIITTKSQWFIRKISITDNANAIDCQQFSNTKFEENELPDGISLKVFGKIIVTRNGEKQLNIDKIEKIDDLFPIKDDLSKKGRYEFHISSKMNTMDGLIEPQDLINASEHYKILGAAIVDLNGVHSFPKFYNEAKNNKNFKAIFGATFSTISKNNQSVYGNINDIDFSQIEFVSFDLETTSLSPRYGDIIEFGSQAIFNSKLKEVHQFFLKTDHKLSDFTINLTNITDEILQKKGLTQVEGLKKIYEILNNKVAIAHNANFDMNWLIEKYSQYGLEAPNTIYVDSLIVGRMIFDDARRFRLQNLANRFNIEYTENEAHRADYDAKVLAQVWVSLQGRLRTKLNISNLKELSEYKSNSLYERAFSDEYAIIAKNQNGLKKLFQIVSNSLTTNYFDGPKVFVEDLPINDPDLLIGSSTLRGALLEAFFFRSKVKFLEILKKVDYVEIPHPGAFKHILDNDITIETIHQGIKELIDYASKYNKIVVAVSDAKYISKIDEIAYKILVYSKGVKGIRHYLFNYEKAKSNSLVLPEAHLLSTSEMKEAFSFLKDEKLIDDIVVENTYKLAELVEDIQVVKDKLYTPTLDNSKDKLYELVYKTAHEKYGENLPTIITERIEKEIQPIMKYGYDVIYWISHKIVQKTENDGYIVGSRGSVGSSFVATMAGITEVNPLVPHYLCSKCKYFEIANIPEITSGFDLPDKKCPKCNTLLIKEGQGIPFETFLGFNADKVPDIDLNFPGEYQKEVHNELKRLFGEKHTFRAGTISTIAEKTGFGYAKAYADETHEFISNTYADYLGKKLQGIKRTTGKHAGGVIIIPNEYDVFDFTPINYAANDTEDDWLTTHFEFRSIHDNVLKFDILGHDDPTALIMLERLTNVHSKDIPHQDPKVISLFSSTEALNIQPKDIDGESTGALGLPEFGTDFVRNMLKATKPKTFADLISLSGISHGTNVWNNNAEYLISKKGLTIKDVISCRDDIMITLIKYGIDAALAFKIMEKVRKGKGVTDEEADILLKNNVPMWYIESMRKIEYMFPKAHATAYVLMAWRIGWFKIYYPLEYYATFFSTRSTDFDLENMIDIKYGKKVTNRIHELENKKKIEKLSTKEENYISILKLAQEFYARGFYIENIDLENSLAKEWLVNKKNKSLIPPFSALSGLGEIAAEKIVQARNEKMFISKEDFIKRTSTNSTLIKEMERMNIFKNIDETDQMKLF